MPRHLGIILDGNRRYALEQGVVDPREAYRLGARKLDDVLLWCAELSIPAVTLWVLSTENFQRTPTEVSGILSAVEAKLVQLAGHPPIRRLGVRVRAVGKLDLLPDSLVAEEATAAYRGMLLTIAVAYGGRQEIIDAVQALLREKAKQGEDLDTRAVPLRARPARPRPHHPHQRRGPALGLPALAERLQRVLLLRSPLAGLPPDRLPARRALLPAARSPLRVVASRGSHENFYRDLQNDLADRP